MDQPRPFRHPLNMIDKFYMALHEIAHTMIILTDFEVRGELDWETYRAACLATFRRLPVLKSVIRGREGWFARMAWEEMDTDGSPFVECLDLYQDGGNPAERSEALYAEAYEKCSNATWDIRTEPPVKMKLVHRGPDLWSLFFLVHHSVSDGHGIRAILEVFAENYTLLSMGQQPPAEPIPQARRGYLKFVLRTPPWKLFRTFLAYCRYERMNRPRATTPFLTEWKERRGIVRALDLIVQKPLTRRITERVRELGISLNEAMILACVRSLNRWILSQGRQAGKISIAVPVNMRSYLKLNARESVANCSVTMNINLTASLLQNIGRLIDAIRFQSFGLKRLRFPIVGIIQTALLSWLPLRTLKRFMARSIESGLAARNAATLVYSNVGMVFVDEKGEPFLIPLGAKAVVESVRFSNPVAYPVAAAMGTITYGGKILVSLSYLHPVLERDAMEAFLLGFQSELFSVLDEKALMKAELPPFPSLVAELGREEMITVRR